MKLLSVIQSAVGVQVKQLYTLEGNPSVLEEDFLIEPKVFSGVYWINNTARLFVVNKEGFQALPIN
jgi:hypothetical protein